MKPKSAERKSIFSPFHCLFNRCCGRAASGYTRVCGSLARKLVISIPLLFFFWGAAVSVAERVPGGFLPDGDQGFLLAFILEMATLVCVFLIPCSYVFIMKLFRIKFSLNELKEDPDEGRPGNT
ncbi:hypothetical protein [Akkermansia massiliensis]